MEPLLSPEPVADEPDEPATDARMQSSLEAEDDLGFPNEPDATVDDSFVHTEDPDADPEDAEVTFLADVHSEPPPTDLNMAFADLKLIRPLQDALDHAGYVHPTPVQESVIPPAMRGKDVIGQAQTGTGKTAAFLIPFLNRWRPHKLKGPIGLVMMPDPGAGHAGGDRGGEARPERAASAPCAVYGGAGMGKQLDGLSRGCDLVVGTPGRMLDHLRRGIMTLNDVRYVVLDEADRMLDIGFRPDIEQILRRCPDRPGRRCSCRRPCRTRSSGWSTAT